MEDIDQAHIYCVIEYISKKLQLSSLEKTILKRYAAEIWQIIWIARKNISKTYI